MEKIWLNSYGEGVPHTIDPDGRGTLADIIQRSIQTFEERDAFDILGSTLTYKEVGALSSQYAAYLQGALKLGKGARIAIMLPNIMAFPVAVAGNLLGGFVQVNVNPMYTAKELKHQLNDSGAETIVIFTGSTPVLAEIVNETNIKNVIAVGLSDCTDKEIPSPAVDAGIQNAIPFETLIEEGKQYPFERPTLSGDDTAFLQYTGGTTGLSKGATLSHRNVAANVSQILAAAFHEDSGVVESTITALPMYHILALTANLLSIFALGGKNYLYTDPRDLDGLVALMDRAKPTFLTGVNTLFQGLTMHPDLPKVDFSNCRIAVGGGAKVLRSTSDRWKAITGSHIKEGYGLSETSPLVTLTPLAIEEFKESIGVPAPSTDIVLLDDEGHEVGMGEPGELCVKGPQVMSGYWGREDQRDEYFTKDGFFRTGDIAIYDEEGFFKIVDRKKDMVIVSGFNVFPNEIEAFISTIDGVAECACIGIPDEKSGEAVKVFVATMPDSTLTEDSVKKICREGLTAYKAPKHIEFMDELPKSNVGKILRKDLRKLELERAGEQS